MQVLLRLTVVSQAILGCVKRRAYAPRTTRFCQAVDIATDITMSREGEARFAYGELIGALFGKRRLAARNIARGRAPEDTSKQGGIALNRSRKELRSRLHSPQSAAGIKGESGEWGKSSAAQPASGAGVKRDEGREKPKGVLPPRFRGWPGRQNGAGKSGARVDQFRRLSASSRCSFFGWFDEGGRRIGLAGVLGFGLLRLKWVRLLSNRFAYYTNISPTPSLPPGAINLSSRRRRRVPPLIMPMFI
jgi:hypothetical protein